MKIRKFRKDFLSLILKILYLIDIFKTVNLLNLIVLQGRRSDLVSCAQKLKGYMVKF